MNAPVPGAIYQIIGRMTVPELCQAICTTMETGKTGTPVNVRLHWEFTESADELGHVAVAAVAIADQALRLDEPVWRIRRHPSGRVMHILGKDRNGRTLMVSLTAEASPQAALTIFGNHGIVRLDDGWIDPDSITPPDNDCRWLSGLQSAIDASVSGE